MIFLGQVNGSVHHFMLISGILGLVSDVFKPSCLVIRNLICILLMRMFIYGPSHVIRIARIFFYFLP